MPTAVAVQATATSCGTAVNAVMVPTVLGTRLARAADTPLVTIALLRKDKRRISF